MAKSVVVKNDKNFAGVQKKKKSRRNSTLRIAKRVIHSEFSDRIDSYKNMRSCVIAVANEKMMKKEFFVRLLIQCVSVFCNAVVYSFAACTLMKWDLKYVLIISTARVFLIFYNVVRLFFDVIIGK